MAETELEIGEMDLDLTMEIDGKTVAAKVKGIGKMIGKMKVRRSLDVGDEVILVRQQGGQKYIMYDKVRKDVTCRRKSLKTAGGHPETAEQKLPDADRKQPDHGDVRRPGGNGTGYL